MNNSRLYQVLLSPHVSEKTAVDAEMVGRHTFRVAPDATKLEVRRAVETLFKVKVTGVQILNQKGKVKRFGATIGKRSDWKKAIVRLADGQDLDFVGIEN
ncbi:MAG: 50S ribosomal protein L23 [Granulosicoccus sp.]|nr:50S ribosomal protein L23 [Granulosicoccus sp.]